MFLQHWKSMQNIFFCCCPSYVTHVQDLAGNWTTRRPPDDRKETQTAVVWSCLLFIRSGQNHLARHIESGKKTRQTEKKVEWQLQGMDRPEVWQVPEGSGEQGKMEKTGCEISVVPQWPSRLRDRWWDGGEISHEVPPFCLTIFIMKVAQKDVKTDLNLFGFYFLAKIFFCH